MHKLLSFLLLVIAGIDGSLIARLGVTKIMGDYLKADLIITPANLIPVLVQMNTIETWLALKDCGGSVCDAIAPTYVPSEPFLSFCKSPVHYQGSTVGYGKPTIQTWQSFGISSDTFSQVVLAADFVNRLYPTSQPGTTTAPAAGVVGLGPMCCDSPLIDDYDIGNQSASLLQVLFKKEYVAGRELQSFLFLRVVSPWGSVYGVQSVLIQITGQSIPDSVLIPLLPGSCSWTFKVSSPVQVYNSATIDDTHVLTQVQKPATVTYDATMDFYMVSAEMAEAYATAFNNLNSGKLVAVKQNLGKVIAYRYAFDLDIPPIFPALSFNATTADGANTAFNFEGPQGFLNPGEVAGTYMSYLPFAFYECDPCLNNWILGHAALNDGVQGTGNVPYFFPAMVVKGSSDGIQQYFLVLKNSI